MIFWKYFSPEIPISLQQVGKVGEVGEGDYLENIIYQDEGP